MCCILANSRPKADTHALHAALRQDAGCSLPASVPVSAPPLHSLPVPASPAQPGAAPPSLSESPSWDTDPRPGGRSLRREHLHLPAHIGDYNGDRERGIFRSRWAIISQDRTFFCHDGFTDAKLLADRLGFRPQRDNYSNLFAL